MFCLNCGAQIKDDSTFCPMCGKAVKFSGSYSSPTPPNSDNGYTQPVNNNTYDKIQGGVSQMENSDSFVFRSLGLTLKTLFSKPFKLWGLSILTNIIKLLSIPLCSVPPILGTAVRSNLSAGMANVFLDAYNGKEVNSKQIFAGFSSGKAFFRTAGGMLWRKFWLFIWGGWCVLLQLVISTIVLIAGVRTSNIRLIFIVIRIIGITFEILYYRKLLSYFFTPYILMKKPDMSPLDALKYSMKLTDGYKVKMFLTNLLVHGMILLLVIVLAVILWILFSLVPRFALFLLVIITLAFIVLLPLFVGILNAAMFTEVVRLKNVKDIKLK